MASPGAVDSMVHDVISEVIREEREVHKANGGEPREYEFSGFKKGAQLHDRAAAVAAARGLERKIGTASSSIATTAMLPDMEHKEVIAALPAPESASVAQIAAGGDANVEDKEGAADGKATAVERVEFARDIEAHRASVELIDDVANGAIVNTGALPKNPAEWDEMAYKARERDTPPVPVTEVQWMIAMGEAEQRATMPAIGDGKERKALPGVSPEEKAEIAANFKKWFEDGGGKLHYVEVASEADLTDLALSSAPHKAASRDGRGPALVSTEAVGENETVISMPLKLALSQSSARNIRGDRGYLRDHIKPAFEHNQRWGMAILLLHEHFKEMNRGGSKWGPYLRSLRARVYTTEVVSELEATFGAELIKQWEADAEECESWMRKEHYCLHHDVCKKTDDIGGFGTFSRTDLRWALYTVHQNSMMVTKKTTGKQFIALVPYIRHLRHSPFGAGETRMDLDNVLRVTVGAHEAGVPVVYNYGTLSDADTFAKHQWVAGCDDDEEWDDAYASSFDPDEEIADLEAHDEGVCGNPNNAIAIDLPGAGGSRDDMFWQLDELRRWRRELKLPPRMSDLWRSTESLQLFGEDEEEQRLLSGANAIYAGLPLPQETATAEEQLELLQGVEANQAQLMVLGEMPEGAAQLYAAPDPEDDPRIADASEDLADQVDQLKQAVAAGVSENATATVVNKTLNFLKHGVMPYRGLDEVDKLILRKLALLKGCGPKEELQVRWDTGPTHTVMCSLRIHLMNETELDGVCPKADGPWFEPKCEGADFNASAAISPRNEYAVLDALRQTVSSFKERHAVFDGRSRIVRSAKRRPLLRAARRLRLRERRLLSRALSFVARQEARAKRAEVAAEAGNMTMEAAQGGLLYQLLTRQEQAKIDARLKIEREEWMKAARERVIKAREVVNFEVDLGQEKHNLTVLEGEELEAVAREFAIKHQLTQAGLDQLVAAARQRVKSAALMLAAVPVVTPDGVRRVLPVRLGDGLNDTAKAVCAQQPGAHSALGENNTVEVLLNSSISVSDFCVMYNISGETQKKLEAEAERRLAARVKQPVLIEVPVTALDGQSLVLQARQGDQHDLIGMSRDFCGGHKLPEGYIETLANEVFKRLPRVILQLPVQIPGRGSIELRISAGDDIPAVVRAYLEKYGLPAENEDNLVQAVHRGLNPGAVVL